MKQEALPGLDNIETPEEKEKKKVRVHKKLGKYKTVTVVPLMELDRKGTGFVSINEYTAEFQFNQEQDFPEKVVDFLKSAEQVERHFEQRFDEDKQPYQVQVVNKKKRYKIIEH